MARNLRWKYGSHVVVEYVDLGRVENQAEHPDIMEALNLHRLRFPLVAIDGELTMSGGISFAAIYGAIDKQIEAGGVALGEEGE